MSIRKFASLFIAQHNPPTFLHVGRTAIAAVISLVVARLIRLPEAYWAPVSTLIVMQSTLGAALPISAQRFLGTAIGAAIGALGVSYLPGSILAFGICVFVAGLLCVIIPVERGTFFHVGITVAIVMLISRPETTWTVAVHRFFEVSIGIAVGLVVCFVWPERVTPVRDEKINKERNTTSPVGVAEL